MEHEPHQRRGRRGAHQLEGTPHPAGDPTGQQATPAQLTSSLARLILPEIHPPGRLRRPRSTPTARLIPPEIQPTAGHTGRSSPTARLILPEIHPHRGPNRHSHRHAASCRDPTAPAGLTGTRTRRWRASSRRRSHRTAGHTGHTGASSPAPRHAPPCRRSNRPAGHTGRAAARRRASYRDPTDRRPHRHAQPDGAPHPAGDPTAQQATLAAQQPDGTHHPDRDPPDRRPHRPHRHQLTSSPAPRPASPCRRSNRTAGPPKHEHRPARLILPEIHPPGRLRRPRSTPTARIIPPEIQTPSRPHRHQLDRSMARLTLPEIHPHRGPNRHSHQPDGVPHTETQPPSRPHRPQQPDRTPHPSGDPPSPRAHPSPSTRRRHASSCPRSNRTRWPHRHAHPPLAHLTLPEIQPPSRPHRPHRPHRHQLTSSTVRLILPEIQPPGRPRRPHSTPTARIIPTEIQPNAGHPGTSSTARPLDRSMARLILPEIQPHRGPTQARALAAGAPYPAGDPTARQATPDAQQPAGTPHPARDPTNRRPHRHQLDRSMARLTLPEIQPPSRPHRPHRPHRHQLTSSTARLTLPEIQPPSRPHRPQHPDGTHHPARDPTNRRPHRPSSPARRRASSFRRSTRPAGHAGRAAARRHASARPRSNQPQATPAAAARPLASSFRRSTPTAGPTGTLTSTPSRRILPRSNRTRWPHRHAHPPLTRLIPPEIPPHRWPHRHQLDRSTARRHALPGRRFGRYPREASASRRCAATRHFTEHVSRPDRLRAISPPQIRQTGVAAGAVSQSISRASRNASDRALSAGEGLSSSKRSQDATRSISHFSRGLFETLLFTGRRFDSMRQCNA
jgi:hypothetical protein